MHHIEVTSAPVVRITVESRPADTVGGWYATLHRWHGDEIAASADLLLHGDRLDPFQAEQLVHAVRDALSVSVAF